MPACPRIRHAVSALCGVLGGASLALAAQAPEPTGGDPRVADFMVVDCLLPGQMRRLGGNTTYLSARRAARLSTRECQIRGGEYVEYDRADARSALGAWLPQAEAGDDEARVIVGEIYERGMGVKPDYLRAANWYRLAAESGSKRAQINLGHLYEAGLGVAADPRAAVLWYAKAFGKDAAVALEETTVRVAMPVAVPLPVPVLVPVPAQSAPVDSPELHALRIDNERQRHELELARAAIGETRLAAQRESDAARLRLEETLRLGRELAATQSRDLAVAQARETDARERAARLEQSVAARLVAGPELTLVEPQLTKTRDIVNVATSQARERKLVGRVAAAAGLTSLTVNDVSVAVNELGVFDMRLTLAAQEMPVKVVAVDRQGKRSELSFLLRTAPETQAAAPATARTARAADAGVAFGRYHALIIGNDDYQTLPDLASPVNDAEALARVLREHYGFETTVLRNGTRYQILSALNKLRETLTSQDNLLIYYAGHGELDEVNQRGHWLPVDAERDSTANWIPSTAITDILNIMKAKQVLLIADSCYAGALTRSSMARLGTGMTSAERMHWLRSMANKRSRTVLASGGLAPVMDAGGGEHSVFAKALLDVLNGNRELLDGQGLHRAVAARVAYAAANLKFDQMPEYAPIRFAGHEAGEFFLIPRT